MSPSAASNLTTHTHTCEAIGLLFTVNRKGECISSTATREEKIVVDAAANDFNKDLFVTSTDITFDLSENYDTDSKFAFFPNLFIRPV